MCGAEAYPDNITYYWYKDGTDVRTLPVYEKRLTLPPDGGLLLTGVVKEDMGWYTCKPSNAIGQDEASAYLNVTCKLFWSLMQFVFHLFLYISDTFFSVLT